MSSDFPKGSKRGCDLRMATVSRVAGLARTLRPQMRMVVGA